MDEALVACGRVVHLALYIQESEESAKQDMAQRRERAEILRRRAGEIRASSRGVSAQAPAFEFDRVLDRVYAGSNPLTVKDVQRLIDEGITHVLDLRESSEWESPNRIGVEAVRALEWAGLTRVNLPIPDTEAPTLSTLDTAMRLLDRWLSQPKNRVYIHCRGGRERTGVVPAACYARKHAIAYQEALIRLRRSRHGLNPLPSQDRAGRKWLGESHVE